MNFKILTSKQISDEQAYYILEQTSHLRPLYFPLQQSNYVFLEETIIGVFQLVYLNKDEIDLRYGIFKDFQNKKLGVDFLKSILTYIFKTSTVNKIYLNIDYANIRSIKVAEKCNFKIDYNLVEQRQISGEGESLIPYYTQNKMMTKEKIYPSLLRNTY